MNKRRAISLVTILLLAITILVPNSVYASGGDATKHGVITAGEGGGRIAGTAFTVAHIVKLPKGSWDAGGFIGEGASIDPVSAFDMVFNGDSANQALFVLPVSYDILADRKAACADGSLWRRSPFAVTAGYDISAFDSAPIVSRLIKYISTDAESSKLFDALNPDSLGLYKNAQAILAMKMALGKDWLGEVGAGSLEKQMFTPEGIQAVLKSGERTEADIPDMERTNRGLMCAAALRLKEAYGENSVAAQYLRECRTGQFSSDYVLVVQPCCGIALRGDDTATAVWTPIDLAATFVDEVWGEAGDFANSTNPMKTDRPETDAKLAITSARDFAYVRKMLQSYDDYSKSVFHVSDKFFGSGRDGYYAKEGLIRSGSDSMARKLWYTGPLGNAAAKGVPIVYGDPENRTGNYYRGYNALNMLPYHSTAGWTHMVLANSAVSEDFKSTIEYYTNAQSVLLESAKAGQAEVSSALTNQATATAGTYTGIDPVIKQFASVAIEPKNTPDENTKAAMESDGFELAVGSNVPAINKENLGASYAIDTERNPLSVITTSLDMESVDSVVTAAAPYALGNALLEPRGGKGTKLPTKGEVTYIEQDDALVKQLADESTRYKGIVLALSGAAEYAEEDAHIELNAAMQRYLEKVASDIAFQTVNKMAGDALNPITISMGKLNVEVAKVKTGELLYGTSAGGTNFKYAEFDGKALAAALESTVFAGDMTIDSSNGERFGIGAGIRIPAVSRDITEYAGAILPISANEDPKLVMRDMTEEYKTKVNVFPADGINGMGAVAAASTLQAQSATDYMQGTTAAGPTFTVVGVDIPQVSATGGIALGINVFDKAAKYDVLYTALNPAGELEVVARVEDAGTLVGKTKTRIAIPAEVDVGGKTVTVTVAHAAVKPSSDDEADFLKKFAEAANKNQSSIAASVTVPLVANGGAEYEFAAQGKDLDNYENGKQKIAVVVEIKSDLEKLAVKVYDSFDNAHESTVIEAIDKDTKNYAITKLDGYTTKESFVSDKKPDGLNSTTTWAQVNGVANHTQAGTGERTVTLDPAKAQQYVYVHYKGDKKEDLDGDITLTEKRISKRIMSIEDAVTGAGATKWKLKKTEVSWSFVPCMCDRCRWYCGKCAQGGHGSPDGSFTCCPLGPCTGCDCPPVMGPFGWVFECHNPCYHGQICAPGGPTPGHICMPTTDMVDTEYKIIRHFEAKSNLYNKTREQPSSAYDRDFGPQYNGEEEMKQSDVDSMNGSNPDEYKPDAKFTIYREKDLPTLAGYKTENSAHTTKLAKLGIGSGKQPVTPRKRNGYKEQFELVLSIVKSLSDEHISGYCDKNRVLHESPADGSCDIDMQYPPVDWRAMLAVETEIGKPGTGSDTAAEPTWTTAEINGKTIEHITGGPVQGGSITFYPYVEQVYDTLTEEKQKVYTLAGDMSALTPTDYIELGWTSNGAKTIELNTKQWTTHTKGINGTKGWNLPNQVLPGGAIMGLSSTAEAVTIGLQTWQWFIPDEEVSARYMSVSNASLAQKRANHQTALDALWKGTERIPISMWVSTVETATDAFSGGQKVTGGMTFRNKNHGGTFNTKLSTESKYWLKDDRTGLNSADNDNDMDNDNEDTKTVIYRVYSDVKGNVYVAKGEGTDYKAATNIIRQWGKTDSAAAIIGSLGGGDEASLLDARTKLITNFVRSIDRNIGNEKEVNGADFTGTQWYNEAWDGVYVIRTETTYRNALINKPMRKHVVDPKLTPYQENIRDYFTLANLVQYRSEDRVITVPFEGRTDRLKDIDGMHQSEPYFLPNVTVMDLDT